ncbi:hypothetical protein NBRC116588_23410 [Pyruvatibacter sp. HU-CL02332]|uniref:PAS domain-containing protein n=1 Tax=Pyruvatibacter sp. HU-CL02332 TaxID=3127650 RepID=UPI0031069468
MLHSDDSKQALQAWLKARGDALFPTTSQFGPFQMRPFLPNIVMIRRMPDLTYRITLVGTALVESFGADATGREVKNAYPSTQHDLLERFYEHIFKHHNLTQSLRAYHRRDGTAVLIEQFMMPVGNEDGVHDRYLLLMNDTPMPEMPLTEPRKDILVGELQRRTVYDPRTLLPVDCELTTPRDAEAMAEPLVAMTPS